MTTLSVAVFKRLSEWECGSGGLCNISEMDVTAPVHCLLPRTGAGMDDSKALMVEGVVAVFTSSPNIDVVCKLLFTEETPFLAADSLTVLLLVTESFVAVSRGGGLLSATKAGLGDEDPKDAMGVCGVEGCCSGVVELL